MAGIIGQVYEFNANADEWTIYQERLEQYFAANKITEGPIQVATLISLIGTSTYKLLRDLCYPELPKNKKYADLCELLNKQFSPQVSEWRERIKFYELQQDQNESVSEWYASLRSASVNCNFGAQLTYVSQDKFVVALRKGKVFDRVCEEAVSEPLSGLLAKAQKKESSMEVEIKKISNKGSTLPHQYNKQRVNGGRTSTSNQRFQQSGIVSVKGGYKDTQGCKHCGKTHNGACRYLNYKCNKCNKVGHLAVICRNKLKSNNFIDIEEELFSISSNVNKIYNPFIVTVMIDRENHMMEIDSGAAISCVSHETYLENFNNYKLKQDYISLKSYTGHSIKPLGYFNVNISYKNTVKNIKLYVVEKGGPSLLGRDWLESFKMGFQPIHVISKPVDVQGVIKKFPNVFSNKLGHYKHCKISLDLKSDAKPIFCKPRAIPLALKDLIDKELDRLLQEKVISPIEVSAWGTPLVPILKNDGTVRLCGDYKTTVNKYLVEVNYPLPRIEEMFAKLCGGKHFTKIDLNQAYT